MASSRWLAHCEEQIITNLVALNQLLELCPTGGGAVAIRSLIYALENDD